MEMNTDELLRHARKVDAWSAADRDEGLKRLEAAMSRSRSSPARVLVLAGAVIAVASVVWGRVRPWTEMDLGAEARIEVRRGSEYVLPPPREGQREVLFHRGELRAHVEHRAPEGPLVVVTPHVSITVVGTRFWVRVDTETEVGVTEGKVRVRSQGDPVELGPGETLRSSDMRLVAKARIVPPQPAPSLRRLPAEPPAPTPVVRQRKTTETSDVVRAAKGLVVSRPPVTLQACEGREALQDKRECYELAARGAGLNAQNALFALGLTAQDGASALEYWNAYRKKFPDGIFAREVSVAFLSELLAQQRFVEALEETERFRVRFGDAPPAPSVALVRAALLRTVENNARAAAEAYEEVLDMAPPPELRADALFFKGLSEFERGDKTRARQTWGMYLLEFPDGGHAAAIREKSAFEE